MRVLIVKTSSMGDVVHNMPVVADVRRALPDAAIDWVVEESYADLVRLVRGVGRVVAVAARRWRLAPFDPAVRAERRAFDATLREVAYDVVLDTQGLVKSAWIGRRARLAPGGHRVGFSFGLAREPLARLFYDRGFPVDPRLHAIERMRALAARALGYQTSGAGHDLGPPRFEIDVPPRVFDWLDAPADGYVVVLHATARAEKAWPVAHWNELVARIGDAGLVAVLPWGDAAELAAAGAIADAAGAAGRSIVAPRLSLADCAALLAGARAVVGVDTGLLHLAAALDVPTVGLFGATPRWRYAPYWSPDAIALAGDDGAQPSPQAVIDALRRLGLPMAAA